jgi:hypothetical protein
MARKAKTEKDDVPALRSLGSRLALIKKRHEELILKPRATIAADLSDELDDPYEELLGADQMELADTVDAVHL